MIKNRIIMDNIKEDRKEPETPTSNMRSEILLKSSVVKARNVIKKKFRDLHNEKLEFNELINKQYKPIIEPLKTLVDVTKKHKQQDDQTESIKKEFIKPEKKIFSKSLYKTAVPSHRRRLFTTASKSTNLPNVSGISEMQTENVDNDDDEYSSVDSEPESPKSTSFFDVTSGEDADLMEKKLITQVKALKTSKNDDFYGFRNHRGELTLGNETVSVNGGDGKPLSFCIKKKEFPITNGLVNLLLSTNPKQYSQRDLDTYKDMLIYTNAHKHDFSRTNMIRRNPQSIKYQNVIKNLFPIKVLRSQTKKMSGGTMQKPQMDYKIVDKRGKFHYTYWDDPNELVDRLRLLISSQAAGHTGHTNEIISILEELQEAKIIKIK